MFFKKHKGSFWDKYQGYNPVHSCLGLDSHIDWVKTYTNIDVQTIMEIGANFCQDSDYLSMIFGVKPENVWCFEAHPEIFAAAKKIHPNFNIFNNAVFNVEKDMVFNMYPIDCVNTGVSSLLKLVQKSLDVSGVGKFTTRPYNVKSIRMDNFMDAHNIKSIDFLKLDAEGVNYEVLQGFGSRIQDIKVIHTESEICDNLAYENQQENFTKIKALLESNGFEMVFYQKYYSQADTLWVRKDTLKKFY